jgi:hypothetical protein
VRAAPSGGAAKEAKVCAGAGTRAPLLMRNSLGGSITIPSLARCPFMGRCGTALVMLALGAFARPAVPANAQVSVCRAPDDLSARTLNWLRETVSSSDSTDAAYRDSVRIPATGPDQVRLVVDEALCRRALEAFNDLWSTPAVERRMTVYQVGRRYVVEDPDHNPGGEYRGLQVFHASWRYQATMLTF